MEALSNADRFVILLRQKLAERASAKPVLGKRATAPEPPAEIAPQRPIAELAAQAGADDRHLRRTIIEQLLTDHLGAQLVNEPRFQQIVERVTEIIVSDGELGGILADMVSQVRGR